MGGLDYGTVRGAAFMGLRILSGAAARLAAQGSLCPPAAGRPPAAEPADPPALGARPPSRALAPRRGGGGAAARPRGATRAASASGRPPAVAIDHVADMLSIFWYPTGRQASAAPAQRH